MDHLIEEDVVLADDNDMATDTHRGGRRRPLTEKRKTQNRKAQRTYREKQKARIEQLERMVAQHIENQSNGQLQATPQNSEQQQAPFNEVTHTIPTPKTTSSSGDSEVAGEANGEQQFPSSTEPQLDSGGADALQPGYGINDGLDLSTGLFPFYPLDDISMDNVDLSLYGDAGINVPTQTSDVPADGSSLAAMPFDSTESFKLPNAQPSPMQSDNSISSLSDHTEWTRLLQRSGAVRGVPYPFQDTIALNKEAPKPFPVLDSQSSSPGSTLDHIGLQVSSRLSGDLSRPKSPAISRERDRRLLEGRKEEDSHDPALDILRRLFQIEDNESNNNMMRIIREKKLNLGQIILAGLEAIQNPHAPATSASNRALQGLADPFADSLNITQIDAKEAILRNSEFIGMSIPQLYRWGRGSLFYRPDVNPTDNLQPILEEMGRNYPPDLRPVRAQVLYNHHPFFDLVPFPGMRERAISLAAVSPPIFDMGEFKMDMVNGGLMCWRGARNASGQPWDMRYWEAAPWFLQKWWMVVGDRDGDVWTQTRWWRAFRGEKGDVMPLPSLTPPPPPPPRQPVLCDANRSC